MTIPGIAFVLPIRTPYRDPLLEHLVTRYGIDLDALYCTERDPGRQWSLRSFAFRHETLPGITIGRARGGRAWHVNPLVLWRLSRLRPRLVVVGGYAHPTMQLAMAWARCSSVPYALICESHGLSPRSWWRRTLKRPIVRAAVKGATALLPTGTMAREYVVEYGAAPHRTFLFPNAPDVHGIAAAAALARRQGSTLRERLGGGCDPIFLYVGRFVREKNLPRLIMAFQQVHERFPRARLVLIGNGPLEAALRQQVAKLRLSCVQFAGFVQPEALPAHYAAADVFVLPSEFETWGVVVQEAMACGLPVVVSDRVGAGRDLVIDGQNGVVVPPQDVSGIARGLVRLAASKELRERMGREASAAALYLDYDAVAASFLECLGAIDAARRR